jgi:hypothetical protein
MMDPKFSAYLDEVREHLQGRVGFTARDAASHTQDADPWRAYFDGGYSPLEAVLEDQVYCDE